MQDRSLENEPSASLNQIEETDHSVGLNTGVTDEPKSDLMDTTNLQVTPREGEALTVGNLPSDANSSQHPEPQGLTCTTAFGRVKLIAS